MDKQLVNRHRDMRAAVVKCMAVACTGLDRAARTLEMLGSLGGPEGLQIDVEGLMQSLLRHPLSNVNAEVSQHRFIWCSCFWK